MKKIAVLLLAFFVVCFSSIAIASPRNHGSDHPAKRVERHSWSPPAYQGHHWRENHRSAKWEQPSMPFRWHERRHERTDYSMRRIYDHRWEQRFPGLHSYRWHAHPQEGFWYHGHRITNAVLFYDSDDELVSIGFMHSNKFIFIRYDGEYENDDEFFIAWRDW